MFWLVSVLCEDLFPDYFGGDMKMLRTDLAVLDELVTDHLPDLSNEFERV